MAPLYFSLNPLSKPCLAVRSNCSSCTDSTLNLPVAVNTFPLKFVVEIYVYEPCGNKSALSV